ncbi:J domain-containing protein [Rhodocytophaga aerolata]|uniref:J domain-containing protein n=1 Tax=Rhodocytophaga aerolata TaxID=455078 RepID=A0ABT8R6I4_9BACT|nr:J domain-containing protein [Rhodocytophaga aerolata]MDO1447708.1 J domain-containing protein [Rhodocytophaga aerolata]
MSIEECYQILDLPPGASTEEIKRAYRKQAKAFHPDINHSADALVEFLRVSQAYQLLSNNYYYNSGWVFYQQQTYYSYRQETPQEKAARFAKMQYEEFKRNNELFKQSSWYMPFKIITYLVCLMGALIAVGFMVAPFLMMFENQIMALYMFPVIFVGIAAMSSVFKLTNEVSQYF